MRSRILAAAMALATVLIWGCGESKAPAAKATLVDAQGQKVGEARLTESPQGVKIDLTVENLPPGVHAFHIHDKAVCQAMDFMSAGGHFNPYHKHHGLKNPLGPHAGDLPNITVGPDGRAAVSVVANLVPKEMIALVEAFRREDYSKARRLHTHLFPLCQALMNLAPNPIAVKTALALIGQGNGELRLPLTPPDLRLREQLSVILSRHGLRVHESGAGA